MLAGTLFVLILAVDWVVQLVMIRRSAMLQRFVKFCDQVSVNRFSVRSSAATPALASLLLRGSAKALFTWTSYALLTRTS